MRARLVTLTLCAGAWLLAACTPPDPLAGGAEASLSLRERYDATPPPVPEVADRLLDLFDDRELKAVVRKALDHNPDLKVSLARLEEAGFNTKRARAPLYPTLDGAFSAARTDTPFRTDEGSFDAGLDARWEVDVWGGIRAGVAARTADEAAAAAEYEAARQSIAAQTMQAWFDLAAAGARLDLARRRFASFEETERSVARRRDAGRASLADLELTRSDTQSAAAAVEARLDERDRAARVVRVLAGSYPDARLKAGTLPDLRRSVPAGLPSDLLRKRPDIDAAYQDIRAADARVQVAHADLFPSFVLTGSAGRSSRVLGDLADNNFTSWSLLAGMSAPLFDGGERRAELGAAGKRAEQAFQRYRGVVLGALREVEDALGSETYLEREETARQRSFAAAREAESRTRRDYELGITELLNLLVAQRQVFSTEEQTINLRNARLKNRVALALALGKGV